MWKAKRKSKKRKNDRKIHECEEFKRMREIWINKTEQYKREFEEFIERRERVEKLNEIMRIWEGKINE